MSCCGGRRDLDHTLRGVDINVDPTNIRNDITRPLKFVILGQSGVGKSSIVLQYVKGEFNEYNDMTIGAAYFYKTVNGVNGDQIKLDIWDTAGQDRYRCIANMYYRGAVGAIVVYDITDKNSFQQAQSWIKEIMANATNPVQIILVGNKLDLANNGRRSVSEEEGAFHAEQNGYLFAETSAKTKENVNDVFSKLVLKIAQSGQQRRPGNNGIKLK